MSDPFLEAVKSSNLAAVRQLLPDADLVRGEFLGKRPLAFACDAEVARLLLEAGADPQALDEYGRTALHWAPLNTKSPDLVSVLLAAGCDPAQKDQYGRLPVELALEWGHLDQARLLGATAKGSKLFGSVKAGASPALGRFIESREFEGSRSWHAVAGAFDPSEAEIAMELARVVREKIKPDPRTQSFKKPPRFVLGDLTLDGDLFLDGVLVVTGDLAVRGLVVDDDSKSLLVVVGSVEARAVFTCGAVAVGGDLRAEEVVYGHYNDNVLTVGGAVRARVVVMDDHGCDGTIAAGRSFSLEPGGRGVDPVELAATFVPEVLKDGTVSAEAVRRRLVQRLPVLR